jgi:hypothetical protein
VARLWFTKATKPFSTQSKDTLFEFAISLNPLEEIYAVLLYDIRPLRFTIEPKRTAKVPVMTSARTANVNVKRFSINIDNNRPHIPYARAVSLLALKKPGR